MATIVILIRHDHNVTVTETFGVGVFFLVLETYEFLDVLNFLVLEDLVHTGVTDIEKLSTEGEDTIDIWASYGSSG